MNLAQRAVLNCEKNTNSGKNFLEVFQPGSELRVQSRAELASLIRCARSGAVKRQDKGTSALLFPGSSFHMAPLTIGLSGYSGVININPMMPLKVQAAILKAAKVSTLIFDDTHPEIARSAEDLSKEGQVKLVPVSSAYGEGEDTDLSGEDNIMLHTSGSTGVPRIVSYGPELISKMTSERMVGEMTADHKLLYMFPLFSAAGVTCTMMASVGESTFLMAGGKGMADTEAQKHLPAELKRFQPDAIIGLPFMLQSLTPLRQFMAPDFRKVISGGMLMSDGAGLDIANKFGSDHIHLYASSELGVASATLFSPLGTKSPVDFNLGRITTIVDPDTQAPIPIGEAGEICVHLPEFPEGTPYIEHREEDLGPFGFRTKDMGRITSSGRLQVVGRLSDIVKFNGRRIEMGPTEELATNLLDGQLAVAVAAPALRTGEAITLFCEAPQELMASLEEKFQGELSDPGARPGAIVSMPQIPRAGMGKPNRSALYVEACRLSAMRILEHEEIPAKVRASGSIRSGVCLEVSSDIQEEIIRSALDGVFDNVNINNEAS